MLILMRRFRRSNKQTRTRPLNPLKYLQLQSLSLKILLINLKGERVTSGPACQNLNQSLATKQLFKMKEWSFEVKKNWLATLKLKQMLYRLLKMHLLQRQRKLLWRRWSRKRRTQSKRWMKFLLVMATSSNPSISRCQTKMLRERCIKRRKKYRLRVK